MTDETTGVIAEDSPDAEVRERAGDCGICAEFETVEPATTEIRNRNTGGRMSVCDECAEPDGLSAGWYPLRPPACECATRTSLSLITPPDGEGDPFYLCRDCRERIGGARTIEGHLLTHSGQVLASEGATVIASARYDCSRCGLAGAAEADFEHTPCGPYTAHLEDSERAMLDAQRSIAAVYVLQAVHYQPAPGCRCCARVALQLVPAEGESVPFYRCLDCNERIGLAAAPPDGHLLTRVAANAARAATSATTDGRWDCERCEAEGESYYELAGNGCRRYIAHLEKAVRVDCTRLLEAVETGEHEALRTHAQSLTVHAESLAIAQADIANGCFG